MTKQEYDHVLIERHGREVFEKLSKASVGIAGLGGLFYIMDYSNGIWSNNGFGDRGWLAIAIVIFATWKPTMAILGSYLFGALYILFNYLNVPMRLLPLIQMLPYLVTIIVLVAVSIRKKRENQPPASLGLSYFREER